MEFDNSNIPINCPECGVIEEGFPKMLTHVIDFHKDYKPEEAITAVEKMLERAYEENEREGWELSREFKINGSSKDRVSGGSL